LPGVGKKPLNVALANMQNGLTRGAKTNNATVGSQVTVGPIKVLKILTAESAKETAQRTLRKSYSLFFLGVLCELGA